MYDNVLYSGMYFITLHLSLINAVRSSSGIVVLLSLANAVLLLFLVSHWSSSFRGRHYSSFLRYRCSSLLGQCCSSSLLSHWSSSFRGRHYSSFLRYRCSSLLGQCCASSLLSHWSSSFRGRHYSSFLRYRCSSLLGQCCASSLLSHWCSPFLGQRWSSSRKKWCSGCQRQWVIDSLLSRTKLELSTFFYFFSWCNGYSQLKWLCPESEQRRPSPQARIVWIGSGIIVRCRLAHQLSVIKLILTFIDNINSEPDI